MKVPGVNVTSKFAWNKNHENQGQPYYPLIDQGRCKLPQKLFEALQAYTSSGQAIAQELIDAQHSEGLEGRELIWFSGQEVAFGAEKGEIFFLYKQLISFVNVFPVWRAMV